MTTQAIVLIVSALLLGVLVGAALAVLWARSAQARLESARDSARQTAENEAGAHAKTREALESVRQALTE